MFFFLNFRQGSENSEHFLLAVVPLKVHTHNALRREELAIRSHKHRVSGRRARRTRCDGPRVQLWRRAECQWWWGHRQRFWHRGGGGRGVNGPGSRWWNRDEDVPGANATAGAGTALPGGLSDSYGYGATPFGIDIGFSATC